MLLRPIYISKFISNFWPSKIVIYGNELFESTEILSEIGKKFRPQKSARTHTRAICHTQPKRLTSQTPKIYAQMMEKVFIFHFNTFRFCHASLRSNLLFYYEMSAIISIHFWMKIKWKIAPHQLVSSLYLEHTHKNKSI